MIKIFNFAAAHVKWFAKPVGDSQPYSFSDTPVLVAMVIVSIVVAIGYALDRRLEVPQKILDWQVKWGQLIMSLASFGFGLAFVLFSAYGYLFAPNLVPAGSAGGMALGVQALAGVMIMLGLYERVGGLLVGALYVYGILTFGFVEMLDALEILGIALFVLLIGRPVWSLRDSNTLKDYLAGWAKYAVPLLRIGTGFNFIILAFSEKLLATSLTNDFLARYDWNFMNKLGLHGFTDHWFAFSAGVAEALIGLFLVLGLATRLTVIGLAGFLVTTLIMLGPIELVGHLPHFSIAAVLLLYGSGKNDKLTT
jgi:uncharacterized membrane protein YphA (DoxX/SURF4 family)